VGIVLADYTTGLYAYAAIVTALFHRSITGIGQYVDIALLDCLASFNGLIESAGLGKTPTRTGNHHGQLAPFGLFRGNGGSVIIGAPNPKLWSSLCRLMGKRELADDPMFCTSAARIKNLNQMVAEIENWLKTFTTVDEPLALIDQAGIPCAKVNKTADLLADRQLQAREMITELETPDGLATRTIKARGNPFKFSAVKADMKKPPNLGQHQDEVLQSIGCSQAMIARLKEKWDVI
jgi:crotonobetainyl-CoA:carnitine CoA-transferase CaiB-like acyl-CoA transferase